MSHKTSEVFVLAFVRSSTGKLRKSALQKLQNNFVYNVLSSTRIFRQGFYTPRKKMDMTQSERKQKIESYGQAHQILVHALERFPREMWHHRPRQNQWTIHEIILHITDSEANSYIRCRRFLAESGSMILGYDEMKWAVALNYLDQSTNDALTLFKWLRHNTFKIIKDLPETAWSNTAEHTEDGTINLDDWLDTYERHIPEHIQQMQSIYDDWVSKTKQV